MPSRSRKHRQCYGDFCYPLTLPGRLKNRIWIRGCWPDRELSSFTRLSVASRHTGASSPESGSVALRGLSKAYTLTTYLS